MTAVLGKSGKLVNISAVGSYLSFNENFMECIKCHS